MLSIIRGSAVLLSLFLLMPSNARAVDDDATATLTMCDLAREPGKYSGKMVRLKAEYAAGLHGSAFFDKACPTVLLGAHTWANTACPGGADAATAKEDLEVLRWAEELYVRRAAAGKRPSMEVVVVGELLLPADYSKAVRMVGGRIGGAGFCHLGASPFKIVVKKVESVTFREQRGAAPTRLQP
ncbi:hypothetical protein [Paludibaculum fermentans]|uniref:hypothetical protein n=1 Tax=Paludibaculum fermentans TaxID=1473598 RepID=UPI003EBD730F